jgi:hypothetical protein
LVKILSPGFISIIGVPSIASNPLTIKEFPSLLINSTIVTPILFGRFFPRCAKIPTLGNSSLFLGYLEVY